MKRILTIFMALVLVLACSIPVMAKTSTNTKTDQPATTTQTDKRGQQRIALPENLGAVSLHDMENLIKPAQQAALLQRLNAVEQKHNVRVVVMTVPKDSRTGTDTGIKDFADDTLNKYYRDEAHNNGSILVVVCPTARKWAISTDNNMRQRITDVNGYPAVSEAFLGEIRDGKDDYNGAFTNYADKVDELLTYYEEEGQPWDPANEFSFMGLLLAALCSAGLAYLFVSYLRSKMSNVRPASEADNYLDRDSVDITNQSDIFLHTTRVVTKRAKDDDSSSSGGGSSSNGGGSGSY